MYTDISTTNEFPKTLFIRNTHGGMIWQVYHVNSDIEATSLSNNATINGFESCSLEDYQSDWEETWPDWRDTADKSIFTHVTGI